MPSLISHVAHPRNFLDDLNYLNLGELKRFCIKHGIPYMIVLQHAHAKTAGADRKGVILDRVRRYLSRGIIARPTRYPASVVCFDPPAVHPKKTDHLFYGQYRKTHAGIMALLKQLTAGEFKDGAIARIVANEFWRKGIAPTYEHYAATWLSARRSHVRPNAEWAFLADRTAGKDTANWKRVRAAKARRVMRVLNAIPRRRRC